MPTSLLIDKTLEANSSLRGLVSVSDFKLHERVDVFCSFVEVSPFGSESVPDITYGGPPRDRGFQITR